MMLGLVSDKEHADWSFTRPSLRSLRQKKRGSEKREGGNQG